jgi:zinc protease
MAFNGTEHFAKQELVDYLESIGMRFGPDLNAYTSFDETVYLLKVPTDSARLVETAFQILEDWARGLSFDPEEIEKERGVVVEEWRLGRGAEARIRDKQFPVLFKDSRYAERLPIGQKAVIDTAHFETITRFYHDWYRPDLMAVIAVGDFDPGRIEGLIRTHFGRLPGVANPRERVAYPVPDHEESLVAVVADPEATNSRVGIYFKRDVEDESTYGAYRRMVIRSLYLGMLNQRLEELTRQPDPPFLFAYAGQGRFVRTKDLTLLLALVPDNGLTRGLTALRREAERVARYGFTAAELERQKKQLLRRMEQAFAERDKTESRRYAGEYVRHFLTGEPIPGIALEYDLHRRYLPEIRLDEVNQAAREAFADRNRVILASLPEKDDLSVPDDQELLAAFAAVDTLDIEPYREAVSEQPLVPTPPRPAPVVAEETIDTLGVTGWRLANGIRVWLKPTDFKNDEVLFTAYSPGGHSLAADSIFIAAVTAAAVIGEGGVGEFDRIELQKKLAGKVVRVTPFIGELQEGLSGSASPRDLETLFQLIYLYCTEPRKDSTAFVAYRQRMEGLLANRSASPEAAFQDTVRVTLTQHHYRARPWTPELLEEMDLERSYAFYRDRFADIGDFTFLFVGNFDLEQMKPLVQTYLGGLPTRNRVESWRDVDIDPPRGIVVKTVRKGQEPKSRTQIVFTGPFEWSPQNRYELESMVQAFRIKLREVLREDLGGTYGVGVWAAPVHYPEARYRVTISFGCAPERVEELTRVVFQQIDSLKTVGLSEKYLTKVKETQRREWETNLKENRYWLRSLGFKTFHGEDPADILNYNRRIEQLSLAAIQRAAQRYFNTDNYVRVMLYPEEF